MFGKTVIDFVDGYALAVGVLVILCTFETGVHSTLNLESIIDCCIIILDKSLVYPGIFFRLGFMNSYVTPNAIQFLWTRRAVS